MTRPEDIYTAAVMQRLKNLHHRAPMAHPAVSIRQVNALCGDTLTLHARRDVDGGVRVSFQGHGCALCLVCADLMIDALDGQALQRVEDVAQRAQSGQMPDDVSAHLWTLAARRDCVMLSWNILQEVVRSL